MLDQRTYNKLIGRRVLLELWGNRIAGGKIVEAWLHYVALGLLQQLGLCGLGGPAQPRHQLDGPRERHLEFPSHLGGNVHADHPHD